MERFQRKNPVTVQKDTSNQKWSETDNHSSQKRLHYYESSIHFWFDFKAISGVFPYPNGSCKKIGFHIELQIYAGVLTKRTSCAIHAFLFLWPEIISWFPFQIVLWTFYQYEVIVTQYIRLVIQAIQSSVCKAKNGFQKMGDQKIESLCISWWSLLFVVFLFGWLLFLLIKSMQQRHAGLEFDSKG